MNALLRFALAMSLTLCTSIPLAYADMAPPDGYVEDCTVAKKEQPGTKCEECPNNYMGTGANNPCKMTYAGTNFAYVCKTWGASFWTEVWCDGPPRVGTDEEATGCSCTMPGLGKSAAVASSVTGGLLLMLLARRRRQGSSKQQKS